MNQQFRFIILTLCFCVFSLLNAQELVREPYVQAVWGDSATIMWKTSVDVLNTSIVLQPGNRLIRGEVSNHEGSKMNEVVIRGLEPGKKYGYSLYANGGLLSENLDYYFYSAPLKNVPFSFYALGDIGAKKEYSFADKPAKAIVELADAPAFGLGLGDIVYPKGESAVYDEHLFNPFEKVFMKIPFYPVLGNHDWRVEPDENFLREWNLPNNEHYYSFEYSNTLFIGLDSRDGNFYAIEEQRSWLESTLKSNQDKYDWIIVYLHHNGRTCTYKKDYEHVMGFYSLFSKYQVDLVLNGHAHTYERLRPLDGKATPPKIPSNVTSYGNLESRFVSITIGAGGKINKKWNPDLENVENCENGNFVAKYEHVPSFGLFKINGKKLKGQGINSITGEVFDEFTISKK